jgi:hypothetical protein
VNQLPQNRHRYNQQGFSPAVLVVLLLVLLVVGAISWKILHSHAPAASATASSSPVKSPAKQTASATEPPVLPADYARFTSDQFHFSLGVPRAYGELKEGSSATSYDPTVEHVFLSSSSNADDTSSAVRGSLALFVYKAGVRQISSRKYGPMISLKNGVWHVTRENASDVDSYKVGDEYREFSDGVDSPVTRGFGQVYSFDSSDEGCTSRKYAFLSQDRLIQLTMPEFCDASVYGDGGDPPTDEQTSSYNDMLSVVLNSIWITK